MNIKDTTGKENVVILMGTFNGRRFIKQQIASLADQSWPHIDILGSKPNQHIENWSMY